MTPETQKLLLFELLDKLLKSWWTLVAGICVGGSAAVIALHFTTPVYEATATIECDVERLPREFVRRTVSDDVQVQLPELRHAVLSDENLNTVITTAFGPPPSRAREQAMAAELSSRVTLHYSIRDKTVSVRYRNQVPDRAAQITNMLADLFVVENKELRAANARRISESMESLASNVAPELEDKRRALSELLAAHPRELESQRGNNEQTIERLQGELEENEQAVRESERRLDVLQAQHARSRSLGPGDSPPASEGPLVGGEDSRIIQLEQELEKLLITLTEKHPDVVAKQRELERRRAAFKGTGDTEGASQEAAEKPAEPGAQLPTLDIWLTRLRAAELEIERMESRSQQIRQEIARYRSYLTNTPATQRRVDELTARVQVLQQMDMENQKKIAAARAGQRLEQEDIANPFVISSYAATPAAPVWPNRLMILVAGVVGGLLLFTGPVLARALLKPTILSEDGLSMLADVPVLVAIPTIPTPAMASLRRKTNLWNLGLSALAIAIAAAVAAMQLMDVI
jgi:uncharacterized protein involved in exopolysaccharide biosynthesis